MFNTDYEVKVYMVEDLICTIKVEGNYVSFELHKDVLPVFRPFGVKTDVDIEDLEEFYEERCFPRERVNCKELLNLLDVPCYEPELICRKTHGLQFDDTIWLQFSDEPQVTWEEIRMR